MQMFNTIPGHNIINIYWFKNEKQRLYFFLFSTATFVCHCKKKLDAGVMEAITKGPAFGDRKLLHALLCPIVKNPRALNFRTTEVMTTKRELYV
jgi:hypothetical protein